MLTAGLPLIQSHPQHQFIDNEQKATFNCFVNGSNSSLTITWEKGEKLYNSRNMASIVDTKPLDNGVSSSLTIKKAVIADSGKYRCNATNVDGKSAVSDEAELLSKLLIYTCLCIYTTSK